MQRQHAEMIKYGRARKKGDEYGGAVCAIVLYVAPTVTMSTKQDCMGLPWMPMTQMMTYFSALFM